MAAALGHTFRDVSLLETALSHRSFDGSPESNERLEFLGDAVLGLVVAEKLYRDWDLAEGDMAKVRADVVSAVALARVARQVGLVDALRLGQGEESSGGRQKDSILADAMEAVLGAVYLDAGLDPVVDIIEAHWADLLAARVEAPGETDFKTRLQEVVAQRGLVPEYQVSGSGPDHARHFAATVLIDGSVMGTGEGTSKKRAQQAAAREALGRLDA